MCHEFVSKKERINLMRINNASGSHVIPDTVKHHLYSYGGNDESGYADQRAHNMVLVEEPVDVFGCYHDDQVDHYGDQD
jgi:hypothetical protein